MQDKNNKLLVTNVVLFKTQGFIRTFLIRERLCSKFPIINVQVPQPGTSNVIRLFRLIITFLRPNSLICTCSLGFLELKNIKVIEKMSFHQTLTCITRMCQVIGVIYRNSSDKIIVNLVFANVNQEDILLGKELGGLAVLYFQLSL
ncbi:hypothetical protein BDC45DRAFT_532233 [Circinella umbellata]|nr:hypothetical protein BDC45DRAFT_532233 [Circinella umbellata]